MISRMAMEDIEQLQDNGIQPTPAEIIRLNAFGLKVERSTESSELSIMPRVAILGNVVFREPTIGSEIWLKKAGTVFDLNNMDTFIQVRAYSLSLPQDKLVDVFHKEEATEVIGKFVSEQLSPYTRDQIWNAMSYAMNGNNVWDNESKPVVKKEDSNSEDENSKMPDDNDTCYDVGLLRNGLIYKIGTVEELKRHTRSELELLLEYEAHIRYGGDVTKNLHNIHLAEYYMVLEEIKEAHKHE